MRQQANRIASLDGLRAISIGLVIIGHLAGTQYFPLSNKVGDFFALASTGVLIFFVISGFLITTLLLTELAKSGNISLSRFYFRRTLRIFPPYYTFILVIFLLRAWEYIQVSDYDFLYALTYTSNYFFPKGWHLGHTWSLSVEEQFYLLWPAILRWMGKRKAIGFVLTFIICCPLIRTLSLFHIWHSPDSSAFEMLADSLAFGCLLALLRDWLHQQKFYLALLSSPYFFVAPVLIMIVNLFQYSTKIYYPAGLTFVNLSVAICLDWCITWSKGKVGSWLNSRVMIYVGTLSYSIYLWQQLFLNRRSMATINSFPINLMLALLTAITAYYVIERPSLQLRQKLETWWQKNKQIKTTNLSPHH